MFSTPCQSVTSLRLSFFLIITTLLYLPNSYHHIVCVWQTISSPQIHHRKEISCCDCWQTACTVWSFWASLISKFLKNLSKSNSILSRYLNFTIFYFQRNKAGYIFLLDFWLKEDKNRLWKNEWPHNISFILFWQYEC